MKNLIIITGSNNHVEKTDWACQLISEQAKQHKVTAINVISEFDKACKLCVSILKEDDYIILEEHQPDDSYAPGRMKAAGAERVWSIQAKGKGLQRCFEKLQKLLPTDKPIIAVSDELKNFVEPGYLLVMSKDKPLDKKEALKTKVRLNYSNDVKLTFQDSEWLTNP